VLLARYSATTRRISRIPADTAGQGVKANRLVMDMSVLAWARGLREDERPVAATPDAAVERATLTGQYR
jgi:hypothetical protein